MSITVYGAINFSFFYRTFCAEQKYNMQMKEGWVHMRLENLRKSLTNCFSLGKVVTVTHWHIGLVFMVMAQNVPLAHWCSSALRNHNYYQLCAVCVPPGARIPRECEHARSCLTSGCLSWSGLTSVWNSGKKRKKRTARSFSDWLEEFRGVEWKAEKLRSCALRARTSPGRGLWVTGLVMRRFLYHVTRF